MTDKTYTDHYTPKPDLEFECPEHYIPQKVTTLSHKQNEPIVKVEEK